MPFTATTTPVMRLLGRALDVAALRHEVLSHNIANAETPNYRRKDVAVDFEAVLRDAERGRRIRLVRTDARHLPSAPKRRGPRVVEESGSVMRNDKNNVDIDREMAELAANSLRYEAFAGQLSERFQMLRSAIREGR